MPRSAPHSLRHFAGRYVGSGRSSGLTLPDTLKLAAAYGLPAVEIRDHANIRQQVSEVLQRPGPVACNVRISPNQATAPRVSSYQRSDGSMASKPMEDMWPLLERGEFLANMLVPPIED